MNEALATLPTLAETFEIIAVDDGSKDRTREIADRLAAEHPDVVRVVHHEVNRGYGGALRSGFEASRYELLCFTDGDRQFKVADLGRLIARLQQPVPGCVVPPDAGVAIGLQLLPHGQRVALAFAGPLARGSDALRDAGERLHVMAHLVGDDVRLGEVAGRAKAIAQLLEE